MRKRSKMTESERTWYKYFNFAHKRDYSKIENLESDASKASALKLSLIREREARRRDLFVIGERVGLNPDTGETMSPDKEPRKPAPAQKKRYRSNYTPRDYELGLVEYDMDEIISAPKAILPRSTRPAVIGSLVEIQIDDHYYAHEIGQVVEIRNQREILVRILTKRPPKPARRTKHEQENPDGYIRLPDNLLKVLELL
jgi:hypothetical protein